MAREAVQRWHINKSPTPRSTKDVLVLGAGIAGCTTAAALGRRGFNVRVVDRHSTPGCEGSGNRQAIVYPKLSPRDDLLPRVNLAAMQFASNYYQPFWQQGLGEQCGVMVLPENARVSADFKTIGQRFHNQPELVQLLENAQLCELAGLSLEAELGLYFPKLGWLPPGKICQQLLAQQEIPLLSADIHQLKHDGQSWQLFNAEGQLVGAAETLVIANAYGCQQLSETAFLPVTQLRGQVTELAASSTSSSLKTVICGQGYITPQQAGRHSCGATYNKGLFTTELRDEDHQSNLEQIEATDAGLGALLGAQPLDKMQGRANYRCTTKDYLPIVGAVPELSEFIEDFASLRRDARADILSGGSYWPNLYVNCGMGSRGLSYAPLTSELLATEIAGEEPPLDQELRLAMHPARFIIRDLKKKRV